MIELTKYKLGDVAQIIGGGTPSTTEEEYWNGEIGWLTPRDLTGYTFKYISKGERNITEEGLKNSSARMMPEGTVLMTSRAPIGYLAIAGNELCTNQGFKSFIVDEDKINNEYLYYLLKSNIDRIKSLGTGSTFAEVSASILKSFEIEIPNIDTQKEIAQILSSLDDKIELNLQMNQTLEAMAQAIFKEWFVNFNFPGFDGELVDGLPKGWRKMKLTDLISTVSITHKFPKGEAIFLNTSDILDGKFLHKNYSRKDTLPGQAKKTIQKGDILFTEIRPANRRYAYVDFESEDYVVSTKLMVLRSKGVVDNLIVYYFMKSDEVLHQLQTLAESRSGTFPQITYDELAKVSMPIPDLETLTAYTEFLKSIFSKARENERQIEYLTQTRDTLLPKLMSGQLEVAV